MANAIDSNRQIQRWVKENAHTHSKKIKKISKKERVGECAGTGKLI